MFNSIQTSRVDTDVRSIDLWLKEETTNARDDQRQLSKIVLQYYSKLYFCLDANVAWLQRFLPEQLKECLQREQADWLAYRKTRFASLNVLYGLLGSDGVSFDRNGLLLEQCQFVRERVLELERFYEKFNQSRRHKPVLSPVD